MSLKCIFIDDDPLCLKLMERHCQKLGTIESMGTYTSGQEAIRSFTVDVDLIFLDVEMPNMSGMQFLDELPVIPNFIFTTSNPQYALNGFQYGAIDYLLKPVSFPVFKQAIDKAHQKIQPQQEVKPKKNNQHLFIKDKGQLVRLNIEDILYFENIKDYVMIFTNKSKYIIYSTLKSVMEKLPDDHFQKVHRSYIINFDKIENIEENSLVIGRKIIPISKAQKPLLMQRLKLL